jgi:hypothetical protein
MNNLDKIKRVSSKIRVALFLILVLTPVITTGVWVSYNHLPEMMRRTISAEGNFPPDRILTSHTISFAILASMVPLGVACAAILVLIRLFGLYAKGCILTGENVQCFRKLGRILIAWSIAGILYRTLIGLVLTMDNPPGQHMLHIGIGSSDITPFLTGIMVLVISWVMDEGRLLQEEQKLVI